MCNGFVFSSWMPRLAEVRDRLGVTDGQLGLTLVGGGIGGLAVSLSSGWVVDRFGSRAATVITSVALSLLLPLVGWAEHAAVLFAALIVLGAFDGLTDVSMNSQAMLLQRTRDQSVMNRFHAAWAAGAVLGGVVAGRAAAAGVALALQLSVTGAALVAAVLVARHWMIPTSPRRRSRGRDESRPRRRLRVNAVFVKLFAVGLAVALAEMPPNDWAALMFGDRFDLSTGVAAWAFVGTASGMFVGRLLGDRVTDRLGPDLARRTSAALAVVGVVTATTVPWPGVSWCGLFVTGLGLSALFPLVFRASSEITGGSSHGMAAFSSGARLGFLLAAPAVGGLADRWSPAIGVLVVSGLGGAVVALSTLSDRR